MQKYRVVVSSIATDKIVAYALHIAEQSGSLDIADRWIDRVFDAIDGLNFFPQRFGLAEEDATVTMKCAASSSASIWHSITSMTRPSRCV